MKFVFHKICLSCELTQLGLLKLRLARVYYGKKSWKSERRFNDKLVIQLSDPNLDTFQPPNSIWVLK